MRGLGRTGSATALPLIQDVRETRPQNPDPHDHQQDEEKWISTHNVERHKAYTEDASNTEGCRIEDTDAVAYDLNHDDPEAEEKEASQSR
jgi:hypothetical protein